MGWKLSKKLKAQPNAPASDSTAPIIEGPPINLASNPRGILDVIVYEGTGFYLKHQHSFNSSLTSNLTHPRVPLHDTYAILEYDRAQVSVDSLAGTDNKSWWGVAQGTTSSFKITRAAELTISIYQKELRSSLGNQYLFLGTAVAFPFDGTTTSGSHWFDVQHGAGRIRASIEYLPSAEHKIFDLEPSNVQILNSTQTVLRIRERSHDNKLRPTWARKTLRSAKDYSLTKEASSIKHPFIAPLAFTCQLPNKLQLFAPCISGGHLFHHLQRFGHFQESTTRLYAAEIISGLEYLHETLETVFWLKSGDIVLDLQGHVTLCSFGLFLRHDEGEETSALGRLEYPPPESLIKEEKRRQIVSGEGDRSKLGNWWTLGILLFEMLTGMPPFYSDDPEKIRRSILDHNIALPETLSSLAREILVHLLEPKPERRLGARGVAEVKAHAFFGDIDWRKILRRGYTPNLVPDDEVGLYKHYGLDYPYESPLSYDEAVGKQFAGWSYAGGQRPFKIPHLKASKRTAPRNDNWELVWEDTAREFRFYNRLTKEESQVRIQQDVRRPSDGDRKPFHANTPGSPNPNQVLETLNAAMINGYDNATLQLLDYGVDLNISVPHEGVYRTPLQWAVTWDKPHLVHAFVARSKKSLDRVGATQTLLLAVENQNVEVINILLAAGVQCNFHDADIPPHKRPHREVQGQASDKDLGFTPPLVRAVQLGNVEIARLLIARGADVNAEYHGLESHHDQHLYFVCGRAIQLAMELGPLRMVQLLVESGADLDPAIVHRYRECGFVERAVYQRVVAGLQATSRDRVDRGGTVI